jgi:hypothetical protein
MNSFVSCELSQVKQRKIRWQAILTAETECNVRLHATVKARSETTIHYCVIFML